MSVTTVTAAIASNFQELLFMWVDKNPESIDTMSFSSFSSLLIKRENILQTVTYFTKKRLYLVRYKLLKRSVYSWSPTPKRNKKPEPRPT
jgi:hypothetical protein